MSFVSYSPSHIAALAVFVLLLSVLLLWGRRLGKVTKRKLTRVLAWLCAAVTAINWISYACSNVAFNPLEVLPLHMCDITAMVCCYALLSRNYFALEFCYFFGLGAAIQGLLTPNLQADFPDPVYFSFFFHHALLVAIALYIPLVLNWRARSKAIRRMMLFGNLYLLATMPINFLLGTNFGFTREVPPGGSLLSHLGDWPYYLLSLQFIGLIMLGSLYFPFVYKRFSEGKL